MHTLFEWCSEADAVATSQKNNMHMSTSIHLQHMYLFHKGLGYYNKLLKEQITTRPV